MRRTGTMLAWLVLTLMIAAAVYYVVPVDRWFADGNEGWVIVGLSSMSAGLSSLIVTLHKEFSGRCPDYFSAAYRDRFYRIMKRRRLGFAKCWIWSLVLSFTNMAMGLYIRYGDGDGDRFFFSLGMAIGCVSVVLLVWSGYAVHRIREFKTEAEHEGQRIASRARSLAR